MIRGDDQQQMVPINILVPNGCAIYRATGTHNVEMFISKSGVGSNVAEPEASTGECVYVSRQVDGRGH
jgi:hypothetical protein